jgi:hypothetical protein
MRIVLIGLSALALTGCGWFDRYVVANTVGHSKTCVEGVTYLQFPSGVTVQVNADGKPITCKD